MHGNAAVSIRFSGHAVIVSALDRLDLDRGVFDAEPVAQCTLNVDQRADMTHARVAKPGHASNTVSAQLMKQTHIR
jgi:hypothetical protein